MLKAIANKIRSFSQVLLYSSLIYLLVFIIFYIYSHFINPNFSILISDQLVFEIRGQGILDGKMPYRDFPTDAAPLSPFLWAPFVFIKNITGIGLEYSLRIFFACSIIFAGWLLYRIEQLRNNSNAALISLIFINNPFFLYLFSFWGSDECIVPMLILLPIYFFERKKPFWGGLFIALGAGLKYFPILLAPLIWYYTKDWMKRITHSVVFLLAVSSFVVPFLLLCKEPFLNQFKDPIASPGNQGITTILEVGYKLDLGMFPEVMRILFLVAEVIVALIIAFKQSSKETWNYRYTAVFFLIFLILYKKIQVSYIVTVFPFATLSLFESKKERIIAMCWFTFAIAFGESAFYVIKYGLILSFLIIIAWLVIICFYLISIVYLILLLSFATKGFVQS